MNAENLLLIKISRMTGYHQKLIQLRVDLNRSEIPNS